MLLRQVFEIFLPNLLTLSRLLAGPLYLFIGKVPASRAQLFWLVTATLTDVVDGRLARYFGTTSGLGATLDTTADKVFVLSLLLKLTLAGVLPKWLFWLVAAQYLTIAVEGFIYLAKFSLIPVPDNAARISSVLAVVTVLSGVTLTDQRPVLVLGILMLIGNFVHVGTAFLRIIAEKAT